MYMPSCTTRIVDTQRAMLASDKEMSAVPSNDRPALCRAYRHRVAALTQAAPVSEACGPPQSTDIGQWPALPVELSFYQRLFDEKC